MRLECMGTFFLITKELVIIYSLLAMLKLYDSRIMSFVLAEAKKKGGKLGLRVTGGIKSYLSNRTVYTFNSKEQDY